MKFIKQYIPDEKLERIFKGLENYLKNQISDYQKLTPYVVEFKNIIFNNKDDILFEKIEFIGKECARLNILYIETLNIIDFLRKNFIAHLPNSTPLKIVKDFERFFDKLESSFSKGYLIKQTEKDYKDFESFKKYIQSKNLESEFYYYFSTHIDYLLTCLKSLFNYDYCIVAIIDTCDFGEWLKERKKDLLKEETEIIKDIEIIHDNFHKLLVMVQNAYHKKKYKTVIFLFEELKNHAL